MNIERKITYLLSILLWLPIGTMYATTAGKGVFSVSAEKTIRFATSPETDFVQWATANAWREEQKNADGHNGWYVLNHDEEHNAATYATQWTSAKTEDFAFVNRTLRKDSTYYTLCLPFDVPDIADSPLEGAEVFEFKGGRVSGAPGNERMNLFLSRLKGNRLTQGVPYLLRWAKTSPGRTLPTPLFFANVENWDTDTVTATDPGNETIKLHGVYPKAHIPGYMTEEEAHYNFFLGANNTLYWPDDSQPSTTPQKILRDGEILLVIDGQLYDLTGRRK